jgi:DNA helicase HerA-like ATPase
MDLRIAENLTLPRDAITQTFAILAKRGVGKTYTASVLVEEIIKAVLPVVVIDPVGVWWGLRASADGKGPGLPIVIAGGDHADVPITAGGGEAVARLVVEENLSLVIDLSLLRKHERIHFMTDFAETLYHLNRTARRLVLDEADAFAPQRPMQGEQRMLGAMEDIVRRGRAHGLGVTLISQRSAALNKNVLTQAEVLVTLRLISPQDRAAVDE